MGGQGSFVDSRIGVERRLPDGTPDLVEPKLGALRDYQLSLEAPMPPSGSFDSAAAQRGRAVFEGAGRCATCHQGDRRTQETLHAPADTGMDGAYASRTATKRYRTTPLRGLFQHPPYFHDGSARTLTDVVSHYERVLGLTLTPGQKTDLVEYLKSI
jgi:mono/diheme cytochrome c family protein